MSDVGWSAVANLVNTETSQASRVVAQVTAAFLAGRSVGGATVITNYFSPLSLFAQGEQGTWYDPSDFSTLFQDSAGTTPVTGVEQVVGLMLDERNPSYSVFFSSQSLSTPNSVDLQLGSTYTVECWAYRTGTGTNIRIFSDGSTNANNVDIYIASGTNYVGFFGGVTTSTYALQQNVWTHLALVVTAGVPAFYADGVAQTLSGTLTGVNSTATTTRHVAALAGSNVFQGYISNLRIVKGTAVYTGNFTPPTSPLSPISGTSLLTCGNSWSGNPAITNNGAIADKLNPFNTGTGNHATSTGAARPTLSARYNLLAYSEEFNNAAWTKSAGGSITATNSTTAPDGTVTADTWTQTATPSTTAIFQSVANVVANSAFTVSCYVKKITGQYIRMYLTDSTNTNFVIATFDLDAPQVTDQTVVGVGASITSASIAPANNGFYRLAITGVVGNFTNIQAPGIFVVDASTGATRLANGSCFLWGAQLLTAADAFATGNAYQRVAAATVYDTSNSVFRPYLAFGGTQAMSTGSIDFTATDKMTVWAGVTKLSDAAASVFCELGTAAFSTVGGLGVYASNFAGANYLNVLRGVSNSRSVEATTFAAPITNVLSISTDLSQALTLNGQQIRVNAAVPTLTPSDPSANYGGGNNANASLFIGARNLASVFLNGRLYSLITRGAQSNAAEISATESWVNQRTGAY